MGWSLLKAFRRESDELPTGRRVLERLAELEGRMDVDEARRHEWVGIIKRTLARINKSLERAADQENAEDLSDNGAGEDIRTTLSRKANAQFWRG